MTEQEQIEEITSIINSDICDKDCPNRCPYCGGLSSREAEKIYNAGYRKVLFDIDNGYGDVSEYKAENERLTKILNSLTFSEKETDIFGKPALLMFAGVKVEEAIKRVTEYDGLNAEIERLRTTLGQCNTELNSALESLKSQCREIGALKAGTKQAKIDVLNKVKERAVGLAAIETYHICNLIDKLIEEVQNGEDKG